MDDSREVRITKKLKRKLEEKGCATTLQAPERSFDRQSKRKKATPRKNSQYSADQTAKALDLYFEGKSGFQERTISFPHQSVNSEVFWSQYFSAVWVNSFPPPERKVSEGGVGEWRG